MPLFKRKTNVEGATSTKPTPIGSDGASASPMPRWVLALRALQFILAGLVLGLAAYAEHIYHGTDLQPAYILAIITALLTLLVFIPLATPLLLARKRLYNPTPALLADLIPCLLWLATLAVLASYSDIFSFLSNAPSYTLDTDIPLEIYRTSSNMILNKKRQSSDPYSYTGIEDSYARKAKRGWRSGAAAAAFSGLEFFVFLLTTLIFLRYFHRHHLATANLPSYPMENTAGAGTQGPVHGQFAPQESGNRSVSPVESVGAGGVGAADAPLAAEPKTAVYGGT